MPALGRYCCKSLKTPGDKFPSRRPNKPRSLIDVASGSLPRSPVSLSLGDEVPHMFTRKPHLRLEKFAMTCIKRFFATKSAQNVPLSDHCRRAEGARQTIFRGWGSMRSPDLLRTVARRPGELDP